jgi:membrane protease YdiL (CAAX protease family)
VNVRLSRAIFGFLLLFLLYQSAEGVGQRILGSFPAQAGLMLLCVVAAWPVGRFILRRRGFDAYALEWQRLVPAWLVGGILLAFATKLLALAVGLRLDAYRVEMQTSSQSMGALVPVVALALLSTFVPSIAEDIITRGFWWRVPGRTLRGTTFVVVTSTIYVLNHVYRLGNGPSEWLMLFCFGVTYALAVTRTGSLWAAVGVHWGWNLANALLGTFATVETISEHAPLLSAAAHLLMAALILLLPRHNSDVSTEGRAPTYPA